MSFCSLRTVINASGTCPVSFPATDCSRAFKQKKSGGKKWAEEPGGSQVLETAKWYVFHFFSWRVPAFTDTLVLWELHDKVTHFSLFIPEFPIFIWRWNVFQIHSNIQVNPSWDRLQIWQITDLHICRWTSYVAITFFSLDQMFYNLIFSQTLG